MCFGWYQEFLTEATLNSLALAQAELLKMLDRGGMIVHVYREGDAENPELVGRHARLRSFIGARSGEESRHEVERFLLDVASLENWTRAMESGGVLDEQWSVVDLWRGDGHTRATIYGKALLTAAEAPEPGRLSAGF